jgi:hypothetical protein
MIEYEGYLVKPYKEVPTSYVVVTAGRGGKIPDVLSGLFTSPAIAKGEIDRYLATKPRKEKDAEAGDKG